MGPSEVLSTRSDEDMLWPESLHLIEPLYGKAFTRTNSLKIPETPNIEFLKDGLVQ